MSTTSKANGKLPRPARSGPHPLWAHAQRTAVRTVPAEVFAHRPERQGEHARALPWIQ